jgi:uncharacterized membrane protein
MALLSFTAIQLQEEGTINRKETTLVCLLIAVIAFTAFFIKSGRDGIIKSKCEKQGLVSITLC